MPNGYTSVLKAGQTLIPLKAKEVFPNRSDSKLIHEVLVYSSSRASLQVQLKWHKSLADPCDLSLTT